MCVHDVWSAFFYQIYKRMHHSRVRHRRMKCTLSIFVKSIQRAIPADNSMDRNTLIHISARCTQLGKGDNLNLMAPPD